jgi:hypothetical protein
VSLIAGPFGTKKKKKKKELGLLNVNQSQPDTTDASRSLLLAYCPSRATLFFFFFFFTASGAFYCQ